VAVVCPVHLAAGCTREPHPIPSDATPACLAQHNIPGAGRHSIPVKANTHTHTHPVQGGNKRLAGGNGTERRGKVVWTHTGGNKIVIK